MTEKERRERIKERIGEYLRTHETTGPKKAVEGYEQRRVKRENGKHRNRSAHRYKTHKVPAEVLADGPVGARLGLQPVFQSGMPGTD